MGCDIKPAEYRWVVSVAFLYFGLACSSGLAQGEQDDTDTQLFAVLREAGFTGRIPSTLEIRLGRPINSRLADLGRLLWFDKITGLQSDNTCGGCHSPTNGFGDTLG